MSGQHMDNGRNGDQWPAVDSGHQTRVGQIDGPESDGWPDSATVHG